MTTNSRELTILKPKRIGEDLLICDNSQENKPLVTVLKLLELHLTQRNY
jgi:hypothetical protein